VPQPTTSAPSRCGLPANLVNALKSLQDKQYLRPFRYKVLTAVRRKVGKRLPDRLLNKKTTIKCNKLFTKTLNQSHRLTCFCPKGQSSEARDCLRVHLKLYTKGLKIILLYIFILRAGIAQSVQRWATGRTAGVRFLAGARDFSLLHRIQTGSGAHPAFYQIGTGALPLGGKAAGA
jgi:hypothetical protein